MRSPTTSRPPPDGGYPHDDDLHRMTDDGGPAAPDPARWSDPDWRDNLGERDTFAEEAAMGFPDARQPGAVTVQIPAEIDPPTVLSPTGFPWSSVRVEGNPAAVWTARRARDGGPVAP